MVPSEFFILNEKRILRQFVVIVDYIFQINGCFISFIDWYIERIGWGFFVIYQNIDWGDCVESMDEIDVFVISGYDDIWAILALFLRSGFG
jgi:hypothetical protein